MKTCVVCGKTKPLGDFYKHRGSKDRHENKCKECKKAYVRERSSIPQIEPDSTQQARILLQQAGIPCTTGKAANYPWADLAAWGCIPIEAKGATVRLNGGLAVTWGLTPRQKRQGFPDNGFFVLIAWDLEQKPWRVLIVPTSEMNTDTAICVTFLSGHDNRNELSRRIGEFENAYHLLYRALAEWQSSS